MTTRRFGLPLRIGCALGLGLAAAIVVWATSDGPPASAADASRSAASGAMSVDPVLADASAGAPVQPPADAGPDCDPAVRQLNDVLIESQVAKLRADIARRAALAAASESPSAERVIVLDGGGYRYQPTPRP